MPDTGEGAPVVEMAELTHFDYKVIAPDGWSSRLARTDWPSLAALPWIVTPPRSVHYRLLTQRMLAHGLTCRRRSYKSVNHQNRLSPPPAWPSLVGDEAYKRLTPRHG